MDCRVYPLLIQDKGMLFLHPFLHNLKCLFCVFYPSLHIFQRAFWASIAFRSGSFPIPAKPSPPVHSIIRVIGCIITQTTLHNQHPPLYSIVPPPTLTANSMYIYASLMPTPPILPTFRKPNHINELHTSSQDSCQFPSIPYGMIYHNHVITSHNSFHINELQPYLTVC